MGPLLPAEGPRAPRIARRVRGIAIELVAFVLATALFPALVVVAGAVDLVLLAARRKPPTAMRLAAMLWWFLFGELRGMLGLLAIWVLNGGRDTPRRRRWVYRLRQSWCAGHLAGVRVLFGLELEIEGLEQAGPGPVLVLIRHASIIDNTLPDAILGRAHGIGLRFVLKRDLELLPTIDIGGRWVPTTFVRRASSDSERELAILRTLAVDLQPDEGILIYPEGTRHTAAKLARAQEIIAERQPEIAPLAHRLRNVLPPRLGGTMTLLEATRGIDVVVCAHVGLDGFEYISDIWSGDLNGTTVRVKFWRHPAAGVPQDRDELVRWLYARWQEVDDWIGEQHRDATVGRGVKARSTGYPRDSRPKETTMGDGTLDEAKGRIKEAAGDLTDDGDLKNEGKVDRATGSVKDAVGDAADKVKDVVGKDR